MLGLSPAPGWRFFAGGKHPCAKDFIHLGTQTALTASLSDWMVRGYGLEKGEREVSAAPIVWRFWLRGGALGEIVCGVLRESSDSIGRPFPLLLVGGGRMPEGESPWQELPLRLSGLWQRMEELSAPAIRDFKSLELGLEKLRPPHPASRCGADAGAGGAPGRGETTHLFSPFRLSDADGFILLELRRSANGAAYDEELAAAGRALTERVSRPPVGAFFGGECEAPRYGVLTRPLKTADFVTLWSRGT